MVFLCRDCYISGWDYRRKKRAKRTRKSSTIHLLPGFFLIITSFLTFAKILDKITVPMMIGSTIAILGIIIMIYVAMRKE